MVNRPQNTANKSYEYSSFPILGVLGTLLVASGVLALVSLFIGVKGAFFGSIHTLRSNEKLKLALAKAINIFSHFIGCLLIHGFLCCAIAFKLD